MTNNLFVMKEKKKKRKFICVLNVNTFLIRPRFPLRKKPGDSDGEPGIPSWDFLMNF